MRHQWAAFSGLATTTVTSPVNTEMLHITGNQLDLLLIEKSALCQIIQPVDFPGYNVKFNTPAISFSCDILQKKKRKENPIHTSTTQQAILCSFHRVRCFLPSSPSRYPHTSVNVYWLHFYTNYSDGYCKSAVQRGRWKKKRFKKWGIKTKSWCDTINDWVNGCKTAVRTLWIFKCINEQ